jgi:hypothetical protein
VSQTLCTLISLSSAKADLVKVTKVHARTTKRLMFYTSVVHIFGPHEGSARFRKLRPSTLFLLHRPHGPAPDLSGD